MLVNYKIAKNKGNDEVYYDCWKSNPNITEWMEKMNFSQYHELGMIFYLV